MTIPLFSKLKGLGPVVVVGTAVLVTIKLLTTQTPQNEEIIQVKAEEDIKTEDYEEKIEPPKEETPPPAPEEEKKEEPSQDQPEEAQEEEEVASEDEDSSDSEDEEEKEEEKEKGDEEESPKPAPRTWINSNNPVVNLLKNLITPKKQ